MSLKRIGLGSVAVAIGKATGLPSWAIMLAIGYAGIKAFNISYFFYRFFIRPSLFTADVKKAGKWAVVTGATDGIGRAMAKELARKGLNVLLISRTAEKLDATAQEIVAKYPKIETKTLVLNFDLDDESTRWSKLTNACKALESDGGIAVLVNNVGISYKCAEYFLALTKEEIDTMIRMNVTSTAWMCKIVMPDMVKRKCGYVVNLASAASNQPTSLLALYSATKADVKYLSCSLNREYSAKGVSVQTFIPFFVASKLSKQRPNPPLVPTADAYARSALSAIGYEECTTGWWVHELIMNFQNTFPWLFGKYSDKMHFDLRRRNHKKQARLAAEEAKTQ